jgi:thymidylate synthase
MNKVSNDAGDGEIQYMEALQNIIKRGQPSDDRTGVGTHSLFGGSMVFDFLNEGFPFFLTKSIPMKSVVSELLWFLEGSTDERRLAEILYAKPRSELHDKKTIWTANADAQGKALGYENNAEVKELGPIYGAQWNKQIDKVVEQITHNPQSRRIIMSSWSVDEIADMALPPCHVLCQFYVNNNDTIDMMMYQRSADMFLGVPFNITSYSILLCMIASITGKSPGRFIYNLGDMHLYKNHANPVGELMERYAADSWAQYAVDNNATLSINDNINDIRGFHMEDIVIEGYSPLGSIKAEMAV